VFLLCALETQGTIVSQHGRCSSPGAPVGDQDQGLAAA
jgi:hypothetical protein